MARSHDSGSVAAAWNAKKQASGRFVGLTGKGGKVKSSPLLEVLTRQRPGQLWLGQLIVVGAP